MAAVRLMRGWLLGVALLLWQPTAGAAGANWWVISGSLDFTPQGTQPGLQHSLLAGQTCQGCHRGNATADAANMPYNSWAGTMMANATRDPLFWAALDVANNDGAANGFPGVGDYCLRCHTPKGWYGGRVVKDGSGGTVDGSNGCLLQGDYDDADSSTNDYGGESCHFCHRLMATGPLGQPGYLQNGATWIDDGDCDGQGEPCRRGPYNDYEVGVHEPPHAWAFSPYHSSGDSCGVCHDVNSPDTSTGPMRTLRSAAGLDTGIAFPIERTYSEWRRSDFGDLIFRDALGDAQQGTPTLARGRSCQSCHMPNSTDALARACIFDDGGARTGNLATHQFAGGNTWVPRILSGQYGAALNRVAEFAQTVLWARAMLQSAAVVQVANAGFAAPSATPGSASFDVTVTNLSGHKLPTGYAEGRRAWINLQVRDANGGLVYESAAYDGATALLGTDPQARVYEVVHGVWDSVKASCRHTDGTGAPQFHFVLNDCIVKDNRIPPLGFVAGDVATSPVGHTYPAADPSGLRLVNRDVAHYSLSVPVGTALPLTATATLYYQTASREYVEFLRNQATTNAFPSEAAMCTSARPVPFTVGPQNLSRGEYAYQLWNNPGYGRSPPEGLATGTISVGN